MRRVRSKRCATGRTSHKVAGLVPAIAIDRRRNCPESKAVSRDPQECGRRRYRCGLVSIRIHEVAAVVLDAGGFFQGVTTFQAMNQMTAEDPGPGEYFGIVDRYFPGDYV